MLRPPCQFLSLAACALLATVGCSSEITYEVVPVSGTVKFADGSVPSGDITSVSFNPTPIDLGDGTFKTQPSATGELQKDGSFSLLTFSQHGAVTGQHKVTITIIAKYPGDPSTSPLVISPKYASVETTPITVEVTADSDSFQLTVEKPNEAEIAKHSQVDGASGYSPNDNAPQE